MSRFIVSRSQLHLMVEQERSRWVVYATLVLVMMLWAGNSIVARAVHDEIGPFSLAFFRWLGATSIVLPFAARGLLAERGVIGRHWRPILLLGVVGVGAFNALLYSGLQYTTATNGLLIQAGIPTFVLIFDRILFGTRPRQAAVVGVAVSAIGVATIVFRADPAALLALRFGIGDVLILAGVLAWSLYTALLRTRPPLSGTSFLAVTFLIGAVVMFPFAAWEWSVRPLRFSHEVILAIAYVAVLPSTVAYYLFNRAVADIGAASAGNMISLQPLLGALLAAPILGEDLHAYHAVGILLISSGIVISLRKRPVLATG
ncbi:DMT family transporter [Novosphingobium sp. M1R2S20]|uniref:DMT family transporter n=1 Tax=Novosphingobium rhizovicinum TaxID=3228928 RepID=A0ABV3RG09_9SPHN